MRRFRDVRAVLLVAAALACARAGAITSADVSPENAEAAVAAIRAGVEVERDILKTQQERYRQAAGERDAANRRLQSLLGDYDQIVQSQEQTAQEIIAAKEREIAEAERQRTAAIDRCRELRGRILEIQDRIVGLEKKIVALREALPKSRDTLTGNWRVTYLPGLNKGVFTLRQAGTIVQGQYQLDGGWKGSLQGTFIDGKIYLQRIDSKLGRSSELQGYISQDGKTIRGTWQNYSLTDGGASSGSWTASREEED
jgi:hypothetical protein